MNPTLIYDAKCPVCRHLALKVRAAARTPLEIVALSDPAAAQLLSPFYPQGWPRDFYLVRDGTCGKGLRAMPGLRSALGTRQTALLITEYLRLKLSAKQCSASEADGARSGTPLPRRHVLRTAALASVAFPLMRLPRFGDGSSQDPGGLIVNVAEVEQVGGGYLAKAWRCDTCVGSPSFGGTASAKRTPPGSRSWHVCTPGQAAERWGGSTTTSIPDSICSAPVWQRPSPNRHRRVAANS